MSQSDRLTRQELTWLLTQEARTAAQMLRKGVAGLAQSPEITSKDQPQPGVDVVSSLDTLDDAMKVLASLHGQGGGRGRRGRIDLAALLFELAPGARVHIEPGSGTDVFGDEAELRRMLQVLLAQSIGTHAQQVSTNPEVRIERTGGEVRVSVSLGPDTVGARGTEHAWLNRMAMRYGGRLELNGGQESLLFPAEGASERSEVEALRKELQEAQMQGEAYARELASVLEAGELSPVGSSTIPPSIGTLPTLVALSAAIAAELRGTLSTMSKDIECMSQRGTDHVALGESLTRGVSQMNQFTSELGRFGTIANDELPTSMCVASALREMVDHLDARAKRRGLSIEVRAPNRADAVVRATATRALIRALVQNAIEATPRDGTVCITVEASSRDVLITVDDSGASVPLGAREALVWRRIDPSSLGRPFGVQLLFACAIVSSMSGTLELGDAPGGGSRTRVKFPIL